LELAQCAHFVTPDGVRGRLPILCPTHMQGCAIKIDLRPFEVAKLGSSQPMSICHKKHRRIPMPVTIGLCGLNQLLNLTLRQVLTATIFAIRQPSWRNCSVFSIRLH
jgi:hypothetical protein